LAAKGSGWALRFDGAGDEMAFDVNDCACLGKIHAGQRLKILLGIGGQGSEQA
jgi:hypothetical protein